MANNALQNGGTRRLETQGKFHGKAGTKCQPMQPPMRHANSFLLFLVLFPLIVTANHVEQLGHRKVLPEQHHTALQAKID